MKVGIKTSFIVVTYLCFPFLVGILPSPTLLGQNQSKKSPCKIFIFDNLIVNCFFQGAPKEEILRCSVADDNTFSDNVFLNKQLTNEAEKDFEAVKVYAVELEHLSMFDKAKHCASIFSYKKVWQWPMTNNITLAFINIDPPDPVNIMLEPKQETTDFMLAETYKLLILRIMTTKVKSMENIYPPVHVKGYQPTEAFKEEIRVV